jgi:hypothetical protein
MMSAHVMNVNGAVRAIGGPNMMAMEVAVAMSLSCLGCVTHQNDTPDRKRKGENYSNHHHYLSLPLGRLIRLSRATDD